MIKRLNWRNELTNNLTYPNQLGGNAAVRPYLGPFGIAAEFGIGCGQGHVMARHFHFQMCIRDRSRFSREKPQ